MDKVAMIKLTAVIEGKVNAALKVTARIDSDLTGANQVDDPKSVDAQNIAVIPTLHRISGSLDRLLLALQAMEQDVRDVPTGPTIQVSQEQAGPHWEYTSGTRRHV